MSDSLPSASQDRRSWPFSDVMARPKTEAFVSAFLQLPNTMCAEDQQGVWGSLGPKLVAHNRRKASQLSTQEPNSMIENLGDTPRTRKVRVLALRNSMPIVRVGNLAEKLWAEIARAAIDPGCFKTWP